MTYGVGRKPTLSPLDPKSPLGLQKGNIKTYLDGLRPLLLRSRFARLGIALQCSSVIWGKINRKESAIFHPFGDSGEGKSFCASIAMSIVGSAEKEDLGNHATSLAGFERVLALLKNLLAIFDELGLTEDDSERVQVGKLVKMAFAFASGHGRTLAASAWGVGIKSSTWHQYGLSTGEESLQEIAQRCAIKLKPGLTRRWIDIPFPPPLEGSLCDVKWDGELLLVAERNAAISLASKTITENYGVALPVFITWILAQNDLAEQVDIIAKNFAASYGNTGWAKEFVAVWAGVAAGGVMGVRAGIIPVKEEDMLKAMHRLCKKAMEYAAEGNLHPQKIFEKFKIAAMEEAACPLVKKGEQVNMGTLAMKFGFRREVGGELILFVHPKKLKALLGTDAAVVALAKKCDADGVLLRGSGGLTQPTTLSDGTEPRFYRFKWEPVKAA